MAEVKVSGLRAYAEALVAQSRARRQQDPEGVAREEQARLASFRCSTCQDSYYISSPEGATPCPECTPQRLARQLWEASGLAEADRLLTFGAFKRIPGTELALAAAQETARGQGPPFLVLLGPPGVGKTHLAVAICVARLEAGDPCMFWVVPRLLDWLRQGYDQEDFEFRFQGVLSAPFLVMDDLGMETETAWVGERLDLLVNHRYGRDLPTAITANPDMLARGRKGNNPISERIASRIQDHRKARVVMITAPDYRIS